MPIRRLIDCHAYTIDVETDVDGALIGFVFTPLVKTRMRVTVTIGEKQEAARLAAPDRAEALTVATKGIAFPDRKVSGVPWLGPQYWISVDGAPTEPEMKREALARG
ncbi:MAG: hypothetical protein AB7P52_17835 [Alphaproteobacteria bacterium]